MKNGRGATRRDLKNDTSLLRTAPGSGAIEIAIGPLNEPGLWSKTIARLSEMPERVIAGAVCGDRKDCAGRIRATKFRCAIEQAIGALNQARQRLCAVGGIRVRGPLKSVQGG